MRRWWLISGASGLALLLLPSLLRAQEAGVTGGSRADILTSARDDKAAVVEPPQRSRLERALYWYDNQYVLAKVTGGWNGVRFAGGSFPSGSGPGLGVAFARATGGDARESNRLVLDTLAARSTRGYVRLATGLGITRIAGAPVDVIVQGQYYEFTQEDFFGTGPDSRQDDHTNYRLEASEVSSGVRWKPFDIVEFGAGTSYIRPSIGSGADGRYPTTEAVFDTATIPGFSEQPDFIRNSASVALDWRDNPLNPHAGGRYSVEVSRYHDRDLQAYGFDRVAVDLPL